MRYRMLIGAVGALAAVIVLGGLVHERPATAAGKDDELAIQKAIDNYCSAFNKGDVDGILAIWGLSLIHI